MPERRRYPSDLSDACGELVEPVLTAWRSERRGRGLDIGRPPDHDLRSLPDALLYVNRTGIPWRYLPHDYPHWNTVYAYFARWQAEGVFDLLNSLLRRQVRRQEGREEEPTACVIDSQSIKTSANFPACEQGIDAGKKIVGRKRSIVIDTVGLLLAVVVTAASVQDSIAGQILIERVAAEHPTVRKTLVDGGYRQHLVEHAATLGIDIHIIRRGPTTRGFTVLPRRWTVERAPGWLMNHRRLARDYEAHPHRSEAMIHLAMINLMTRRLAHRGGRPWLGVAAVIRRGPGSWCRGRRGVRPGAGRGWF
ncbi:IS5 family transposase [Streptomyces sp. NBC_01353]|uniref:IS5 family transposase n=1 Tax=Streptomyces sp. NBC_01353 TaxID=2903835 RepID=UPI002E37290A|nr:IS5 family transposase [Streptomyces sp. NBC_01353]